MQAERNLLGIGIAAVLFLAATCLGVGIHSVGVLTPGAGGTPASAVYAVSPDGAWAVGFSTGVNVAGTAAMDQAIIWSSGSGLVQVPNAPMGVADQPTSGRGVVVSGDNLIVGGKNYNSVAGTYRMAYYSAPLTDPGTGTWTAMVQHGPQIGEYNAVRTKTKLDGTPEITVAGRRNSRSSGMVATVSGSYYEYQSTGTVPPGSQGTINSNARVTRSASSENPVGAGWDNGNPSAARRAIFFMTPGTAQTIVPGGNGLYSEAYGIVPESSNVTGATLVGYDRDANSIPHAFIWNTGDAAMSMLPELSGGQSTATDVRRIGGNLIIGGSAFVGSTESAVMWDQTGTWDATGQATLVSDALINAGFDVSPWSSLTRVTTMSDDGKTIGGYGVWAEDGTTRGFVASIPEPATLTLLALGASALLRRRR